MKKYNITKEKVMLAIEKALEDKKQISRYLKGEITKEQLEEKGIILYKNKNLKNSKTI